MTTFRRLAIALLRLLVKLNKFNMGSAPSRAKSFQIRNRKATQANKCPEIPSNKLTPVCLTNNTLPEFASKLEKALCWTSKFDKVWSRRFSKSVNGLLLEARDVMSRLVDERDYSTADEIVARILLLRGAWGDEAFHQLKINSFPRERIKSGTAVILTGQYFKPEPFYEGNERLLKTYFFEVRDIETGDNVFTYFLEYSNVLQTFYVLCVLYPGGRSQVARYGGSCPSYWTVRNDVLRDFTSREDCVVSNCD